MGCSSSAGSSTTNPKSGGRPLTFAYFPVRGGPRGMVARYLLAYCNVPYNFKEYAPMSQEWKDDKANDELAFWNLPHIIDGKTKITESVAVHQYIAMKGRPDVMGKTPQDKANRYRMQSIVYE